MQIIGGCKIKYLMCHLTNINKLFAAPAHVQESQEYSSFR